MPVVWGNNSQYFSVVVVEVLSVCGGAPLDRWKLSTHLGGGERDHRCLLSSCCFLV